MTFGYSKLCLKVIALYFAMMRYSEALGAAAPVPGSVLIPANGTCNRLNLRYNKFRLYA